MNRNQRHMERLHRRRKRRIILSVILGLMVITTCTLAAVSYFSTDVYKDEKEFEEYAREELNKSDQFIMEGQTINMATLFLTWWNTVFAMIKISRLFVTAG